MSYMDKSRPGQGRDRQQKARNNEANVLDPWIIDVTNRDPNGINDYLKVAFEDVLAEPGGAHSNDCVWTCSYRCFIGTKLCCYRFLTLLCGCWMACCWGLQFSCITFVHIWQLTPILRMLAISCGCLQTFWGTALQCFLSPICYSFAMLFTKVQVANVDEVQMLSGGVD